MIGIENSAAQDHPFDGCSTNIHETVIVQGTVTLKPKISLGRLTSFCIGRPVIGDCCGEIKRFFCFPVIQKICVEIPLIFGAEAEAAANGIIGCTNFSGLHDSVATASGGAPNDCPQNCCG